MLQNHKGFISFGMLIAIFILIVGTIVILGIYKMAFAAVEPEIMKKVCKTSNMLILGLKEKVPMSEYITMRGRACKTIDIESPSDAYPQTTVGAKDELRNSIIECADEWLMGIDEPGDVTGEKLPFTPNKCFVCRSYKVKKDVGSFGVKEFEASLYSAAYRANDASDRCAKTGGYCAKKCDDLKEREDLKDLEVNFRKVSGECEKEDEVCCVPDAPECVKRGGRCYLLGTKQKCRDANSNYPIKFRKWSCDDEKKTCCVKDEYADTYYEEIRYNRAGNILIDREIENFTRLGEKGADVYAVVFVDKNPGIGEENVFMRALLFGLYAAGKTEDLYIFFKKKFGKEYVEPPYIYVGKFKDAVEKAKCSQMRDISGK